MTLPEQVYIIRKIITPNGYDIFLESASCSIYRNRYLTAQVNNIDEKARIRLTSEGKNVWWTFDVTLIPKMQENFIKNEIAGAKEQIQYQKNYIEYLNAKLKKLGYIER